MVGAWLSTLTTAASTTASSVSGTNFQSLDLVTKGLITTVMGLLGVFLVLLLFFFAIKLMQNFKEKEETQE